MFLKRIWLKNKNEVINANANISEKNSGINTDGRSDNLQDKNESRASSMTFSGHKPEISLKDLKIKKMKISFGKFNISSLWNKFEQLHEFDKDNLDTIETQQDISFPSVQFHIPGYGILYSLDCNSHRGGILLYIRETYTFKTFSNRFWGKSWGNICWNKERESGY